MMGGWRQFFVAILLIAVFPAVSCAEEASAGIDPSLIIEQFDVFTDGDNLLVPVKVFGKTRLFVVDTGCTWMVYDASLRRFLGPPLKTLNSSTHSGNVDIELFSAPPATLGNLDLQTKMPAACLDLTKLREVSGQEIEGIVGMSFLRRYVVHVDADAGKLMILRSLGAVASDGLPLTYSQQLPFVAIDIPSCDKRPFMIDTGFSGRDSGAVDTLTFEFSVMRGYSREVAKTLFADAAGTMTVRRALFKRAFVGDLECRMLVMGQSKERRLLSLRFMTRFNVTFDFPKNMLYLEKSRHFDRPDRLDLSGLHFLRRNGQVVVDVVDDGSPAALDGIKANDIIVSVNGDDASEARLFEMRETLSLPGTSVHVKLKRGDEVVDVELKLPGEKSNAEREVVGR